MLPPSCQQNVHLKTCLISNWQIPSRHSPSSDNTICFATIPFCRLICIFKRRYKGAVLASLRVQLTGHCVSTPSIGSAVVSEIRQKCNDAESIASNTARLSRKWKLGQYRRMSLNFQVQQRFNDGVNIQILQRVGWIIKIANVLDTETSWL